MQAGDTAEARGSEGERLPLWWIGKNSG